MTPTPTTQQGVSVPALSVDCPIDRTWIIAPLDIAASASALALLEACGLGTADIHPEGSIFLAALEQDRLIGIIGVELHGEIGHVRSMAVDPVFRGRGVARGLYQHLEDAAKAKGVSRLFLLTETAQDFFCLMGYEVTPRSEAPFAISMSNQFARSCPSTALLMKRDI